MAAAKTAAHSRRNARPQESAAADLVTLLHEVRAYVSGNVADRTREAYGKQWTAFERWCSEKGMAALPAAPGTLCLYLAHRARQGRRIATLAQGLSAIAYEHTRRGHSDPLAAPDVAQTWAGIRRKHGASPNQKAPATTNVVRAMVQTLPSGLLGVRDRALITLGFAGGFRRSELVALDVADLRFRRAEGVEVTLRRSKTDQEGQGQVKEIARGRRASTCPVAALKDWLELAEITEGPVFRGVSRHGRVASSRLTSQVVALVIKRAAAAAGLDAEQYSGHSLRAGLVTAAKQQGVDDADIMRLTGHRSLQTLHGYDRRVKRWSNPASARLGL